MAAIAGGEKLPPFVAAGLPPPHTIPTKTCLGCGQSIPVVYTVCPYCRFDPTAKKKAHGRFFASFVSILAGISWFASAIGLLSLWVSGYRYSWHPEIYYFYGGILLHISGFFSIVVGLLSAKREGHYMLMMILSIIAGGIGAYVGFILIMNIVIGEIMLLNIGTVLILFFYREEFTPEKKPETEK